MTLICFASQKGSPGTSAAALAVAAAFDPGAGRRKILLEADLSGGALAIRYRLPTEPGLVTLAAAARAGLTDEELWRHAGELPGGLPAIVCPDGPEQVHSALAAAGGILGRHLAGRRDLDVIADLGRLQPGSPAVELAVEATAVLMVARPTAEQLQPAAQRMLALRPRIKNLGWLLIGEKPHGPAEVEATFGFPVVGVLADDRRSVEAIEGGAVTRKVRRHPFVRSAATVASTLGTWLSPLAAAAASDADAGGDAGTDADAGVAAETDTEAVPANPAATPTVTEPRGDAPPQPHTAGAAGPPPSTPEPQPTDPVASEPIAVAPLPFAETRPSEEASRLPQPDSGPAGDPDPAPMPDEASFLTPAPLSAPPPPPWDPPPVHEGAPTPDPSATPGPTVTPDPSATPGPAPDPGLRPVAGTPPPSEAVGSVRITADDRAGRPGPHVLGPPPPPLRSAPIANGNGHHRETPWPDPPVDAVPSFAAIDPPTLPDAPRPPTSAAGPQTTEPANAAVADQPDQPDQSDQSDQPSDSEGASPPKASPTAPDPFVHGEDDVEWSGT